MQKAKPTVPGPAKRLVQVASACCSALALLVGLLVGAVTVPAAPAGAVGFGKALPPGLSPSGVLPSKVVSKNSKASVHRARPAPNPDRLLAAVSLDERQLVALAAYEHAQSYLVEARARSAAVARVVTLATSAWAAAKASEARAIVAEGVARARVGTYTTALSQLGLAEYAGVVKVPSGTDVASQQRRLELAELSSVAGADTASELSGARAHLEATRKTVAKDRALVVQAWAGLNEAKAHFDAATAQVRGSERALALARRWAVLPETAPPDPAATLVAFEGNLAAQSQGTLESTLERTSRAPDLRLRLGTTDVTPSSRPAAAAPKSALAKRAELARSVTQGPGILGKPLLTAAEIEGWYATTGARARTTVPFARLVADYVAASRETGVRADLAFAQSVVETGYFTFPAGGQLTPKYNNFAGIGACDKCKHGWHFANAKAGVLAQEQLLEAYASPSVPPSAAAWVRGLGVQGCCTTWLALSGIWASDLAYGYTILSVYKEMLDWALDRRLEAAELLTPERASRSLAQVSRVSRVSRPAVRPAGKAGAPAGKTGAPAGKTGAPAGKAGAPAGKVTGAASVPGVGGKATGAPAKAAGVPGQTGSQAGE